MGILNTLNYRRGMQSILFREIQARCRDLTVNQWLGEFDPHTRSHYRNIPRRSTRRYGRNIAGSIGPVGRFKSCKCVSIMGGVVGYGGALHVS